MTLAEPVLNASQRRAIAAVLRSIEQRLSEMDEILDRPSVGFLSRREPPVLDNDRRARVVATIGDLRTSIGVVAATLGLNQEEVDPLQRMAGLLAVSWQGLGEIDSRRLARYGDVRPGVAEALDPLIKKLIDLVSALGSELES